MLGSWDVFTGSKGEGEWDLDLAEVKLCASSSESWLSIEEKGVVVRGMMV